MEIVNASVSPAIHIARALGVLSIEASLATSLVCSLRWSTSCLTSAEELAGILFLSVFWRVGILDLILNFNLFNNQVLILINDLIFMKNFFAVVVHTNFANSL